MTLAVSAAWVRMRRRALVMAVQRGVRVRLLVQGKYEHFLQYHAARPVFRQLLRAGVLIHEYAPSALHAKVAVVDRRWATVGSSNLDPLSLLLAREANIVSTDADFAQRKIFMFDGRVVDEDTLHRLRQEEEQRLDAHIARARQRSEAVSGSIES